MTDEQEQERDIEDMGPGDMPEPGPDEPQLIGEETPEPDKGPEEEHTFRESAREGVGKAVGIAVELGSILGGEGGRIVEAQRDVAAAETEDLIDRVDGEG